MTVQAAGIRHRYITPRRVEQNGKVERSHRIDDEEFWQRESFGSFDDATVGLDAWDRRYNHERFSMALRGHTPGEILAANQGDRNGRAPGSGDVSSGRSRRHCSAALCRYHWRRPGGCHGTVLAWAVRAFFIVAALTPLALVVPYRWKDVNLRKKNIQNYVDAVKQELAASHLSDPQVTFGDYHSVPRYVLPLTLLTLLMLASSYITYSWVCSHVDPVAAADPAAAGRFPLVAIMALAGGIVWTLQQVMTRVYDGELGPPDLMEISVGLFAAVPIGFAFSLVTAEVNELRSFAAFAAAAFPVRESLRLIRQFTVRKMLEPGGTPVSRPAECHLGTAINGVSDAALARLAELRIVTAVDMAYSDPVKVMVQTGFPLPVIIDWMDQSLWVLYAGDRKNELARLGIRCSLDVCEFVDMHLRDTAGKRTPTAELAAEDKAALAAVAAKLDADPALVADMFFRICNDPQVRVLRLLWYQGWKPLELGDGK